MSIDHGKLLALCDVPGMPDQWDATDGYMHGWNDCLRALAQPAEAVQCIWPDCGHDTNQSDPSPGCNGKFCPKPAEAAEDITDLVMQPGAACPTCKQFLHVQPAEAVEGDATGDDLVSIGSRMANVCWNVASAYKPGSGEFAFPEDYRKSADQLRIEWDRARKKRPTHDAAQGAVAEVYAGAFGIHYIACADPNKLPVGTKLYTRPQAAPAQGDDAFLRRGLWECFKLAGGDTDGASGPEAIDNADLTIIAVRTVRDLRECYDELAAAPSQEGES